jgi:segregation and condensation protein B
MGAANSNFPDMVALDGSAPEMQAELGVLDEPGRVVVTVEPGRDAEAARLQVLVGESSLSLASALESLLFVADVPVEPAQFARVLNVEPAAVEAVLRQLAQEYQAQGRGLRLLERGGRFLMISAPAAAPLIEAFLNLDTTTKLSGPALETLAIVAYRQPVTRAQVEAVRGVDCSGVLRSLLQRGLLEETGRLETPGRPVLYGVTDLFLQHFGLTGMHELPPLEDASAQRLDAVLA